MTMEKIIVAVNIGPITSTKNMLQYQEESVENVTDKMILIKAIESAVKKLKITSDNFMAGFISVIFKDKEITHTSVYKIGKKISFNKNIEL